MTQGRINNCSILIMDFPTMENSDILEINKGGGGCTHDHIHTYTDTKDETELVGMETNSNFLWYQMHLLWRADIEINISGYCCKEINITDIWDSWLLPYRYISPYGHPDSSVDWYYQGSHQWPPLVILQYFMYPGAHCGCHYARWVLCGVLLEG